MKPCFNFVKYAFFSLSNTVFLILLPENSKDDTCPSNSLGICVARGVTRADAYLRTENNEETRASSISVYTYSVTHRITTSSQAGRCGREYFPGVKFENQVSDERPAE